MGFDIFMYSIALILLSFISAMIGFAFNKMLNSNMIFHKYYVFLEWLGHEPHKTITGRIVNKLIKSKSRLLRYIGNIYVYKYGLVYTKQSKFLYYLAKPLGLCIICNTFWIGVIFTSILKLTYNITIFDIVLISLVSSGLVNIIEHKFNQLRNG